MEEIFRCHGYGHFQIDCHNRKTFTIREVQEIQAIEEQSGNEEI